MSRTLTCTTCGCEVAVFEEPVEFIDPGRFRCTPCLSERHAEQLAIATEGLPPRVENRRYDPEQAAIPY